MGSERIELAYDSKSVKKNCATAQFFRIYQKKGSVRDYASTVPTSDRMSGIVRSEIKEKGGLNEKSLV